MRLRLALISLVVFGVLAWPDSSEGSEKPLEGIVLVIDPGHAVKNAAGKIINPGAHGPGNIQERDIALQVSETIAPLLEAQGAKVFLTRTSLNPWRYGVTSQSDNRGRAILANLVQADAYVRIHCDWNRDKRFKGHTTFFYRWGSRALAESVNDAMARALVGHRDNGIKRRSFVSVSAQMPAVLVELGVLSNKQEGKEMAQEAYKSHLAMAVAEGIVDYFRKKT